MRSPGRSLGGVTFSGLLRSRISWLRGLVLYASQQTSACLWCSRLGRASRSRLLSLATTRKLGTPPSRLCASGRADPCPSQSGGEMNTNERLLATFQCFGLFGLASAAPSDHRINRRERRRAGDVDSPVEAATRTRLPRESLWCAGSTPTRTGWARRTEIERWPLKARRARWCRCLYTARSHCRG